MSEPIGTIQDEYRSALQNSNSLYSRACEVFPNGVTHDSRFAHPFPVYANRAAAGRKWDVDGREYVDYWMGHGALLLGHCHPALIEAVTTQVQKGTHYGACHPLEVEWGEWVKRLVPSAERVRFTSSGTEATLMALRLARTYTGKRKIVKFLGHFHGWHDNLMVGVNPPFDEPVPPGILREVADSVCLSPPNDIHRVEEILQSDDDIACVIIEPTGGAWGTIPTREGFLRELRELTCQADVPLIFDEVITGFRCSPGGAQEFYEVTPDLTSLAKILAGGLPGGCLAGKEEILSLLDFKGNPEWDSCRKMPHPGTFNANPLSAAAGIAMLKAAESGEAQEKANENADYLRRGMNNVIDQRKLNWVVYGDFSGFKILPDYDGPENAIEAIYGGNYDFRKLKGSGSATKNAFHAAFLLEGVDLSGLAGMTSSVHTKEDLDHTIEALDCALHRLNKDGIISSAN